MTHDSVLEPGKNYGIPERTPASTSLWAHLLRKDTARGQSPNLGPVLPPVTPLDKNGTSMRILLHDTQAHLDRFSERADKLFNKVDETKREISIVNTLFQREHGTLTEELVDLVNRSQTQLQNSIGNPAQTEQLERLSKNLNVHIEGINKRLDAIHTFNQTHSHMLQLQSQAIQSLQEQHGTMLTALLPLLPLLQAIPLHIESARNKITDLLTKPLSGQTEMSDQTCDSTKVNDQRRRSKRSSSTLGSDSSPSPLNCKKARTTPSAIRSTKPTPVPSACANPKEGEFGSLLRGYMLPASASSSRLIRQETTIVPSPRSTPPGRSAPKQVDLGAPNFIPLSAKSRPKTPPRNSVSLRTVDPLGKGSSTVHARDAIRPPPTPLFSSRFASPSPDLTLSSPTHRASTLTRHLWRTTQTSREETSKQIPKPSAPRSDTHSTKHINPNNLALYTHNRPSTILIGPACHPGQHFPPGQRPDTNSSRPPTHAVLHRVSKNQTPNAPALRSHAQASSSVLLPDQFRKPLLVTPPIFAPQQAKVRERRSPPKEGRRFIPLDDSDDDGDIDGNGDVYVEI